MQPEHHLSPNGRGDCYVCSAHAILKHFGREYTLEQLYAHWCKLGASNGATYTQTCRFWRSVRGFDAVTDPPVDLDELIMPNGMGRSFFSVTAMAKRVRVYLEAGYLVHSQCLSTPRREIGWDHPTSNHLVVIDGYREEFDLVEKMPGAQVLRSELHVVCSARGPYWIPVGEWVREQGGFEMWFVRPTKTVTIPAPVLEAP